MSPTQKSILVSLFLFIVLLLGSAIFWASTKNVTVTPLPTGQASTPVLLFSPTPTPVVNPFTNSDATNPFQDDSYGNPFASPTASPTNEPYVNPFP